MQEPDLKKIKIPGIDTNPQTRVVRYGYCPRHNLQFPHGESCPRCDREQDFNDDIPANP